MNIVQPDALFVHIYTIDNIAAAAAAAVTVEQSVVYVSIYTYIFNWKNLNRRTKFNSIATYIDSNIRCQHFLHLHFNYYFDAIEWYRNEVIDFEITMQSSTIYMLEENCDYTAAQRCYRAIECTQSDYPL